MKNFAEFLNANREKIHSHAEANTLRNADGQTVIERSDPWFGDDVWDAFEILSAALDEAIADAKNKRNLILTRPTANGKFRGKEVL